MRANSNQEMTNLQMRLNENAYLVDTSKHFKLPVDINLRQKEVDAERQLPDMTVLMCMLLLNDIEQVRYRRMSGPDSKLVPKNMRDDVVSLLHWMETTDNENGRRPYWRTWIPKKMFKCKKGIEQRTAGGGISERIGRTCPSRNMKIPISSTDKLSGYIHADLLHNSLSYVNQEQAPLALLSSKLPFYSLSFD